MGLPRHGRGPRPPSPLRGGPAGCPGVPSACFVPGEGPRTTAMTGRPPESERKPMSLSTILDRALAQAKMDLAPTHRQPSLARVIVATVLSIVGSLLADAALVAIGTSVFPATKGYVHFQFHDYAKLTVVGVIVACAAWPMVTRVSSAPRWIFLRLAVLVTLVLFLPDLWILAQ